MNENIPNEILFDKRLQERFIRQGIITRKQLDEWLAKLADLQTESNPSEATSTQE